MIKTFKTRRLLSVADINIFELVSYCPKEVGIDSNLSTWSAAPEVTIAVNATAGH